MAEYRDEKETLRRRVAQLEAELSELSQDDRRDADTIGALRAERDALRDELAQVRAERDKLEGSLERVRARAARDPRELGRRALPMVAGVAGGALVFGVLLVVLGAPGWASAAVFGAFALASLALLAMVSPHRRRGRPDDQAERIERAAREKQRAARNKRRSVRARVAAERESVSVKATRRRGRKRRKGRR